jgi:chemotaxis-related protein WspB
MLFLLFQLGKDRYALDAAQVAEVLPLVELKRIPQAPPGVAGMFNFRGCTVPVIDLSELTLGRPSRQLLSTRIALVNYPTDAGPVRLLGIMVEHATETIKRQPSDFSDTGVAVDSAPYLGPVTQDERGLIQWIEVRKLLPAALQELLFREPAGAGHP